MCNTRNNEIAVCGDTQQLYVTLTSARNVARNVVNEHFKPVKDELERQRKEVVSGIINEYAPEAIPSDEEKNTLKLTTHIEVSNTNENGDVSHRDICNSPIAIKPLDDALEIPLIPFLALNQLDERSNNLLIQEDRASDRLFAEIMHMGSKERIESEIPELAKMLRFEPFAYGTEYWKQVLDKIKKEEDGQE